MNWYRDACIWVHVKFFSLVTPERWSKIKLRATLLWFLPELLLLAVVGLFALVVLIHFIACWITGDWKSWNDAMEHLRQVRQRLGSLTSE